MLQFFQRFALLSGTVFTKVRFKFPLFLYTFGYTWRMDVVYNSRLLAKVMQPEDACFLFFGCLSLREPGVGGYQKL